MLLALLGMEGVLRCLPVNSGIRMANTTPELPFARYVPRQPFQYSFGWAMDNARSGVTNAVGIVNSRDPADGANALVIGDSYIEAFMVHYPETVQGRLDAALGKVYSVGMSGNGLADSLAIAQYYVPRIHPKTVVMFVEPFDLSLIDQKTGRGHSHFVFEPDGVSLEQMSYVEPGSKRIVLRSSLLLYTYYNLKLQEFRIGAPKAGAAQQVDPLRVKRRDAALGYYLAQLQALQRAHGTRFVFLVDGDRGALYSPKTRRNWQHDDRAILLRALKAHDFAVTDMQPVFEQHWRNYHERMDFLPTDGHWNKVGHKLAADALLEQLR
ncbi:alginate O-acetyltransferase AlgX-related protein [Pseudoduganella lutea]|nr:hypothetical protein [Pseudoduganella lutea]